MSYGIENIREKLARLNSSLCIWFLFITNFLILVAFIYVYIDDRNKQLVNIKMQEIGTIANSAKSAFQGVEDRYFLCYDRNLIGSSNKAINISDQSIDDWGTSVFNIKKLNRDLNVGTKSCSFYAKKIDRPLEIDRPIQFSPGEKLSRTGRVRMASYQDRYFFVVCLGLYINKNSHQCDDIKAYPSRKSFKREYKYKAGDLYNNLALKIYVEGNEKPTSIKLDYPASGSAGKLDKIETIDTDSFTIYGQWMRTSNGLLIYEIELPQKTRSGKILQQIRFVSTEYKHTGEDEGYFKKSIHDMETNSIYKIESSPIALNNKLFFSENLIGLATSLREQYSIELTTVPEYSGQAEVIQVIAELYPPVQLKQNIYNKSLLAIISGMDNVLKQSCNENSSCSVIPKDEYSQIQTNSEYIIKYSKPIFSAENQSKHIAKINVILNPDKFIKKTEGLPNISTSLLTIIAICTFLFITSFILFFIYFRKLNLINQNLSTLTHRIFHDIAPYRREVLKQLKVNDRTNYDKADFCFKLLELHHDGITEKISDNCKQAREKNAEGGFYLFKAINFVIDTMSERHGDFIDFELNDKFISVWGDKLHFVFILENIVKNANRHRTGGTRVKITQSLNKTGAVVTVFNQGSYISGQDKRKIFRFGYKNNSAGTGMGLFFVKNAIKGFGGSVDFQNIVNPSGVMFTLYLPNDGLDTISSEANLEESS